MTNGSIIIWLGISTCNMFNYRTPNLKEIFWLKSVVKQSNKAREREGTGMCKDKEGVCGVGDGHVWEGL